MRRIWLATGNPGKLQEFIDLLRAPHLTLVPAAADFAVPETGQTFAENAALKAAALGEATGEAALADDSGLVVAALDGAPGLHSARYSGVTQPQRRDAANRHKLLAALRDVPDAMRQAYFVCAIALYRPGQATQRVEARLHGHVPHVASGTDGFGYDAIFCPEGHAATLAALPRAVRYVISHRAQAVLALQAACPELGGRGD